MEPGSCQWYQATEQKHTEMDAQKLEEQEEHELLYCTGDYALKQIA